VTEVVFVEYDFLINEPKVEKNVDFSTILNETSKYTTPAIGEPLVK